MFPQAPVLTHGGWAAPGLLWETRDRCQGPSTQQPRGEDDWPLGVWGLVAHSEHEPVVKWSLTGHRLGLKLPLLGQQGWVAHGDGHQCPKTWAKEDKSSPNKCGGGKGVIKPMCSRKKVANH